MCRLSVYSIIENINLQSPTCVLSIYSGLDFSIGPGLGWHVGRGGIYLFPIKECKQTNKYGRRTERHLPKTDESVVGPAGERR